MFQTVKTILLNGLRNWVIKNKEKIVSRQKAVKKLIKAHNLLVDATEIISESSPDLFEHKYKSIKELETIQAQLRNISKIINN